MALFVPPPLPNTIRVKGQTISVFFYLLITVFQVLCPFLDFPRFNIQELVTKNSSLIQNIYFNCSLGVYWIIVWLFVLNSFSLLVCISSNASQTSVANKRVLAQCLFVKRSLSDKRDTNDSLQLLSNI